nr:TATA box-binding protein-associated factor, RNA polymerase I, subunit C-like [Nerophis lumbriciformis]
MDYQFPQQLFSSYYNCGPPDLTLKHCAGNWGSYDRVRLQGSSATPSNWTFTSRHQVRGEVWCHTEPIPVPLFSPKKSFLWSSSPPDPLDFTEHMQNFFFDHCQDAFGCMSEILGNDLYFKKGSKKCQPRHAVNTGKIKRFIDMLDFPICHKTYSSTAVQAYSALLSDVLPNVPSELLGSLLYEELTKQRDSLLFSEEATGGALDFIPFSESGSSQRGCLIYPGNQGLDRLNFHTVALEHHGDEGVSMNSSISKPFSFQLKGPIRQISSASLFNNCCVAVRSDHLYGVWKCSEQEEPRLLQVIKSREAATCVSVSPHVLGEVLVASESGTASLWTVGKGIQKVREDDSNLYFNAKSSWRWCEFSAHPRVMLYADRTGAELCDIRVSPASNHTLFRIGRTTECRSGERLILSKYLGDTHSFHHLFTTQYSAYIMDERFPSLHMLKMDHMMEFPPMFCHILPGVSSSAPTATTKVLLCSQSSQEITMLQYSGGKADPCVSLGPPQALLRPCDSLKHLPVQIPHRMDTTTNRLSSPAAGLTCIQKSNCIGGRRKDCFCVLQLTVAGDIFYQTLEPEGSETSSPPAKEDEPQPQQTVKILPQCLAQTDSQLFVPDTSSDEDMLGPTQGTPPHTFIDEIPQWKLQDDASSETGSEEFQTRGKGPNLKKLNLQVLVNDDPVQDHGLDTDGEDGKETSNKADDPQQPDGSQETTSTLTSTLSPTQQTAVKLSESAVSVWKHWLQKLTHLSLKNKPRLHHLTLNSGGLLRLSRDKMKGLSEEEHVKSTRNQMRVCMSNHSLLVRSADSADIVPIPDQVDTSSWMDPLSQRLTASWQSEELWRAWWHDQLGLNKDEKMDALRRKRRRERDVKRSAGRRLNLTGSFTSSVSYQSGMDSFSDFTGWSSAASQGAWSDTERVESLSQSGDLVESGRPRAQTTMLTESTCPTPTTTPRYGKDTQDGMCVSSTFKAKTLTTEFTQSGFPTATTLSNSKVLTQSQTTQLESTPSSQRRRIKRRADDYLASLFGSQDGPSQHDNYFLDECGQEQDSRPPMTYSSQLHSSQSTSISQNSLRRPGSQLSQPKKKKSQMGF